MANDPRGECVGFSAPSPLVTAGGLQQNQWSTLANVMNGWLQSPDARRIWIRDIHVDIAHGGSRGKNALHAYILYEQASLPFRLTQLGALYEARFFEGPLPPDFSTWEEWFANAIDDDRNFFVPKVIVPVPPAKEDLEYQESQYFTVGLNLTSRNRGQNTLETSCLIGIALEGVAPDFPGGFDLYDSSGTFTRREDSVFNKGQTTISLGEVCLVIPEPENSDHIALPMCCPGGP